MTLTQQLHILAQSNPLGDCDSLQLPNCQGQAGLNDLLETAFLITGVLAVLFIFIGGFKYVVSGGDPKNTESAKNTILYAVVGLIISIFAFTIVKFVATSAS